ncbi:MAG: glycoside hydrolase family 28 protein [Nibricoccus sp.]
MNPAGPIFRFLHLPTILSILLILSTIPGFSATATFNVRDFGAVGDGTMKDTAAFQRALDTCAVSGGGEVLVPAGRYLIGSIQLGTRTTLRFATNDSILVGSPDANDYPMVDVRWEGRWQPGRRALIYADNVDHIAIVGPGRIEGNAEVAKPQNPRGVVILEPINCNNVRWENFTVTQGGNWATHPTYCTDVVIKNLTIRGLRDGIDVDSCKNVLIEGCDIETGDDAISLKSGRGMDGARIGRPTEDVVIKNCKLRCTRFASIGIGSETSAGVRNVRIESCMFDSKTHAIYIKTRIGRAGITENITAENLEILNGGFLRINLTVGGNTNTADDPVPGPLGYPSARNLSFTNIRLHNATTVVDATQIAPEKLVENLTLADISGTAAKGISLANMKGVTLRGIFFTGFSGPLLSTRNVTGTGLENATPLPESALTNPPATR